MKYETIVDKAKNIKEGVETNYKPPFSTPVYYIAKAVLKHDKNDVGNIKVDMANKSSGNTINDYIYKTDYLDMAKRFTLFVESENQLPNWIAWKKYKVKVSDYVYMFSRILVYFDEHNELPAKVKVDSGAFKKPVLKKYGHATKSGCDNRGQNNSVYCGPHSMQECIRNLTGKVISQSQLASWAGTGSGGTDHYGIETAIAMAAKKLGVKLSCKWYNFSDLGWSGIRKIINSNNQDCIIHNLYRDQWGHYETINEVNDNINVQNSLGDYCSNGCYCGYIEYRTKSEFESYIYGISQKSVLVITRS